MNLIVCMGGALITGIGALLLGVPGLIIGLLIAYCLYERMAD